MAGHQAPKTICPVLAAHQPTKAWHLAPRPIRKVAIGPKHTRALGYLDTAALAPRFAGNGESSLDARWRVFIVPSAAFLIAHPKILGTGHLSDGMQGGEPWHSPRNPKLAG